METENKFKYYAFISYKREDEEWAKWLQHKLEHYKLPSNLNGRTDLPKEIRPVFKDTSELNPGNLPQQIHDALEQSKFLIVICSPRSAKSEWVNKEVETFMEIGKTSNIIPFIIDGKAFAKNPDEECFPKAIRDLPSEQEILGANIGEMGRDAAAVKVVAQMFGLKFDELWQRHERERRRKRITLTVGVSVLVLIALIVSGWICKQRTTIRRENWIRMENEAKYVAEIANDLTAQGRSYEAQRILMEVLPKDLEHPDCPCVPAAINALKHAILHDIVFVDGDYCDANYSPDGKTIVAVSHDTIRILEAENGKTIRVLGHYEGVQTAAFSPNGSRIVSCIYNNFCSNNDWIEHQSIIIIDVDSGKELLQLTGHDKEITYASYSSDGKCIVSSSHDGTIRVWDAENGKELLRLNRNDGATFCSKEAAKFSPDGKQILGVSDTFIRVWDAENGQERFSVKTDGATHACYSPDGTLIYAAVGTGMKIYNAENGKEDLYRNLDLSNLSVSINYLDISDDLKAVLAFSKDAISILDFTRGKSRIMVVSTDGNNQLFGSTFARFAPDGQHFITIPGGGDGYESNDFWGPLKIWKVNPFDMENMKEYIPIFSGNFSLDGKEISLDGKKNGFIYADSIVLLDAITKKRIRALKNPIEGSKNWTKSIFSASFSPDGNLLASGSNDGTIKVWNVETGEEVLTFKSESGRPISGVSYSPNGKHLVSCSWEEDKTRVWDVEKGKLIRVYDVRCASATYSPDGKYLLYYVWDFDDPDPQPTVLSILDVESGKTIRVFSGHKDYVTSAEYSPDGKRIVSCSFDGTIRIWDVENGEEIDVLDTKDFWGIPSSVAFSTDGKHIVASFLENNTIEMWYWPSMQELIDQTRERFKDRPLTDEERRMYYLE